MQGTYEIVSALFLGRLVAAAHAEVDLCRRQLVAVLAHILQAI